VEERVGADLDAGGVVAGEQRVEGEVPDQLREPLVVGFGERRRAGALRDRAGHGVDGGGELLVGPEGLHGVGDQRRVVVGDGQVVLSVRGVGRVVPPRRFSHLHPGSWAAARHSSTVRKLPSSVM
jgi:hypothetical protein